MEGWEEIPYDLLLLADESVEAIEKYIFQSENFLLVLDDQKIGVFVLKAWDGQSIEIKNIAIQPEFQSQGKGRFMLKDAEKRALERGYSTFIVGTGDGSIKQLNFYRKMGFKDFDIRRDFFIDNYEKPIFENGIQLRNMVMLKKELT